MSGRFLFLERAPVLHIIPAPPYYLLLFLFRLRPHLFLLARRRLFIKNPRRRRPAKPHRWKSAMETEKRTPDHFRNGGGREAPGFPGSFSLEALLEKAPAAVILTSRDGRVLYCNEALLRLTGYGRDEVRRMSAQSVYCCLEDRERFISELRRRGSVETMETVLTRKDGRLIRGRFSSVLVATEPEEIIFSVIEDCTELRRLKGETQLQAEMLASSVAAIAAFDPEGRLTYVNPAGLRLFGYDGLEEVLGRPAPSFTRSPGEAEQILDAVRAFGAWEGRLTALKRDGAPFEIVINGRLFEDRDGGD